MAALSSEERTALARRGARAKWKDMPHEARSEAGRKAVEVRWAKARTAGKPLSTPRRQRKAR
jgi:hypothetical protein